MKEKQKIEIEVPVKERSASFADPLKYKILTDETINLTKARAFDFLESKSFPGERSVRELHVQHLYDEWVAGRFLWHHVILAIGVLDGVHYRVNGQHTCWMRVNIPERYEPLKSPVREIVYRVEDMESLRNLYSAFDRNAPRTIGHISKVLLMDTDAGQGLPPSYIGKLMAGFKIFFSPDNKHRYMSPDDWIGMITKNYPQLFNLVGRFYQIHACEATFISRAAVLAAMFGTFDKNVKGSDEFWSAVASGIGLEAKTDARWQLRTWLQEHSQSIVTEKKKTNSEETFRICIMAWNRWRDKEAVTMLRTTDKRVKAKA